MSIDVPTRLLLVLMIAALFTATVTDCAATSEATPTSAICDFIAPADGSPATISGEPPGLATPGVATIAADQVDLVLIDALTAHLEASVVLAQIALDRAARPEVRALARTIVDEQTGWLAQLQQERDAWYPNAVATPLAGATAIINGLMTGMLDMPATPLTNQDASAAAVAMCTTPGAVDPAYLALAIPHLQAVITIANVALENSTHPELTTLAGALVDAIQQELDQLTAIEDSVTRG